MNKSEFIVVEQLRSNAFNLFSYLLLEPDEDLFEETSVFKNLGAYLNKLQAGKGDELINLTISQTLQQLQVEYARLFIGPFKVPAPPYSSINLGEKNLMSDTTVWVNNFYKEAGLEFDTDLKDLPDHAAIETEFMYYLIFNELSAIDQGFMDDAQTFYNKQKVFFENHYKKWIPVFCDKVCENTEFEYFKILFKHLKFLVTQVPIPNFSTVNVQ